MNIGIARDWLISSANLKSEVVPASRKITERAL